MKRRSAGEMPAPVFAPEVIRLMRVTNEYFSAGAVWKKSMGSWVCISSAPIIAWMRKCDPGRAKLECARRGLVVEWI